MNESFRVHIYVYTYIYIYEDISKVEVTKIYVRTKEI